MLGARFYLGRDNNGKPLLLVAPGLGNAVVTPTGRSPGRRPPAAGLTAGNAQNLWIGA